MKLKSLCAVLTSFFILSIVPFSSYSTNAARVNVKLGDVNGDGVVTILDALNTMYYIGGKCKPTPLQLTAMDVNQDYIIDRTDVVMIQEMSVNNINEINVSKELYSLPNTTGAYYVKYNVADGSNEEYFLSSVTEPISTPSITNRSLAISGDEMDHVDNINTNVVELSISGGYLGSGFIISNHVIATAAHCVYNKGTSSFCSNINIKIHTNNNVMQYSAKSYHIPKNYITTNSANVDNFDYALIYVEDDLSTYGIWDCGIAVKELTTNATSSENHYVTTSGFCTVNNITRRYFSTGSVIDFSTNPLESHNNTNLRLATSCETHGGKSGGVMYYESCYANYDYKSAIAVISGGMTDLNAITWGVKLSPIMLKFYKHNDNL